MEREVERRERIIVRTSVIGIGANVALAAFKAAVGLLSRSIAVVLDAVNNLSDALSSVITIAGTKIALRRPDKKHPLGHGRVEYLSALIVSAIVLYAGITSLVEAVKKIVHPEKAEYSALSLVILAAAVAVKFFLGRYVTAQGKRAESAALEASGADASFDAIISLSVLVCALIARFFGVSLEAYVGAVISVFILKAGVEMISGTLDDILGARADADTARRIKEVIVSEPEVRGAFDLFVNNYGPGKNYASVHVELPDVMTVEQADVLTRRIQVDVYRETGVILTGVGVYSYNTKDDEAAKIRNEVMETVMAHEWALQMHGFHADTVKKEMRFDVVVSFDVNPREAVGTLTQEIAEKYPDYTVQIVPDVDITD
ncbi:MAG: cation transporter [Oscillibacter sp.]|nr:cation transporter [Oscillibacter sp.]